MLFGKNQNFRYNDVIRDAIVLKKRICVTDFCHQHIENDDDDYERDYEVTRLFCCDGKHWKMLEFFACQLFGTYGDDDCYLTDIVVNNDSTDWSWSMFDQTCFNHVYRPVHGRMIGRIENVVLSKAEIKKKIKARDIMKIQTSDDLEKILGVEITEW